MTQSFAGSPIPSAGTALRVLLVGRAWPLHDGLADALRRRGYSPDLLEVTGAAGLRRALEDGGDIILLACDRNGRHDVHAEGEARERAIPTLLVAAARPTEGPPRTPTGCVPMEDPDAVAFAIVRAVGEDRSRNERRRPVRDLQEVLRSSETRFRLLVESLTDQAIVMLDPTGRVTSWSAGAQAILGYSAAEAMGRHVSFVQPKDECIDSGRLMELAAAEGRARTHCWRLRRDGERFWAEAVVTALRDEMGQLQGFAEVTRDLSEDRLSQEGAAVALQSEREARAEAERASELKDEFLSVLSHELRTPLSAIVGWAHLLRQGSLDAGQTREALETIERNARVQDELLSDVVTLSRILSGRLALQKQPLELGTLVLQAVERARRDAERRKLALQAAVAEELPELNGDGDRLQQVVRNLLRRAIWSTPAGGGVGIRVAAAGPAIEIRVTDTGRGIDPARLASVFDRFRWADAGARRDGGLGLAVVRHLVELHGGSVRVESPGLGQGSTFTVKLPLEPRPSMSEGNPAR